MKRFDGRVAVVTGAASGIGRALSCELAGKGCELALVDVDAAGLAATAEALRGRSRKVSLHTVDVADVERMQCLPEDVVAQHGHVHIVVNNAGVAIDGTIAETSIERLHWIVGVTCVHPGGVRTNIVRSASLIDEARRAERVAEFERIARMSPERAARRIVRAIERNRMRLRLGPETYVIDWIKRLFPVVLHRAVILRGFRRFEAQQKSGAKLETSG